MTEFNLQRFLEEQGIDPNGPKLEVYADLTLEELANSGIDDSKFKRIFLKGTYNVRDYNYMLNIGLSEGASLTISTELRKNFLAKGNEKEAENTLQKLALGIRAKTGGYFDIHCFYGAVNGTHFSPITNFSGGADWEHLSMIIHLTDNGSLFDERLTEEAVSLGVYIEGAPDVIRYLRNRERAYQKNPNQPSRDQAIANRLGKKWDKEFLKYNPQARKGVLAWAARKAGLLSCVPPTMQFTQRTTADFITYLQQEIGFRDLRISEVHYALRADELDAVKLPRAKLTNYSDFIQRRRDGIFQPVE